MATVSVLNRPAEVRDRARTAVRMIPTDAIRLHPELQRFRHTEHPKQREARVREIVSDPWDVNKAGVLLVIPSDQGGYDCCDGGHRLEAARRVGEPMMRCLVVEGLDVTVESERAYLAELVLAQEERRNWTDLNKYEVRVQFGLQPDTRIEEILRDNGVRGGKGAGRRYTCVTRLRKVYGQGTLFSTIFVIETAWRQFDEGRENQSQARAARCAQMVGALGIFTLAYRDHLGFSDNVLAERLGRRTPLSLIASARYNAASQRTTVLRELCDSFLLVYNHGRRTGGLPAFKAPRRQRES